MAIVRTRTTGSMKPLPDNLRPFHCSVERPYVATFSPVFSDKGLKTLEHLLPRETNQCLGT